MAADLSNLLEAVQAVNGVVDSAIALLNGLSGQVRDLGQQLADQGVDVAQVNELADAIDQKAQALADAIAANSPDEEPPPPAAAAAAEEEGGLADAGSTADVPNP